MSTAPSNIPPPNYYEEDEVTLKDIILGIKSNFQELIKYPIGIIVITLLTAGIGYWMTKSQPTTYTAGLSFLVKKNNSQASREVMSPELLRLGIGGGNIENNKLVELARSGRIINEVLFKKVNLNEKDDFLANHIIDVYGFQDKWNNEPLEEEYQNLRLENFSFKHANIDNFEQKEYRALSNIRELISGNKIANRNGLLEIDYDKTTEIIRFEITTLNGGISIQIIQLIFEELKSFYEEETTGRTKRNYETLKLKVDDLAKEIQEKESALARASDQTLALVSRASLLRKEQIERDLERVSNVYRTLVEKKQEVEYSINTESPDFLVVDQTFLPIKNTSSLIKMILIGAFIGLFFASGLIILRKIIRDALQD